MRSLCFSQLDCRLSRASGRDANSKKRKVTLCSAHPERERAPNQTKESERDILMPWGRQMRHLWNRKTLLFLNFTDYIALLPSSSSSSFTLSPLPPLVWFLLITVLTSNHFYPLSLSLSLSHTHAHTLSPCAALRHRTVHPPAKSENTSNTNTTTTTKAETELVLFEAGLKVCTLAARLKVHVLWPWTGV